MKRDGEGCGRCVQCSPHGTQSAWWECRGGRATEKRMWVKEERKERRDRYSVRAVKWMMIN